MEENNQHQQPLRPTQGESKAGIGFICAFFLGLIGLIVGFCCYKENSYERQTFMKAYWTTVIVMVIVSCIIAIIYFVWISSYLNALI